MDLPNQISIEELLTESMSITREELLSQEIENTTGKSFLVQAGYLTFKEKIDFGKYKIAIPNIDAGQSLTQMVLEINYKLDKDNKHTKSTNLRNSLPNICIPPNK
ncbi:MAG: hypothetical protein N2Z58_09355 [Fervidobacterium sp.]|nr:hypothetical protein [Fervidobacterium sp.]